MAISFQKATREQVWLKVLLSGASGSGKSRSALELAQGITKKCGSKIAYIGTEGSRDKYYASKTEEVTIDPNGQKLFPYDLLQIDTPQTPEKYIEAIDAAIEGGYKVLIIDSISHEWKTINDIHDKMPGNSFTNWSKLKPRHRDFMDKVLFSPIHVIATGRGKDEWVLEDKNGKQVPKKVGMGVQSDKDITYEYTLSLMIEQDTHIAHADKDNTGVFKDRYDVITEKDGEALYDWANDSDIPATVIKPKYETPEEIAEDELKSVHDNIVAKAKELAKIGDNKETVMGLVKEYSGGNNPRAIKELDKAKELLIK